MSSIRNRRNRRASWLCGMLALAALGLAGCVRETVGGLPAPASAPERAQAQLDLARGYLQGRDWTRAKPPLLRALQLAPSSVEARVLLGLAHEGENEAQLAEEQYRAALALDPQHAQALNNYGAFLYRQGRFQEALEPLRKLVQRPDYRLRAQAYENLGLPSCAWGVWLRPRRRFSGLCSSAPRSRGAAWNWRICSCRKRIIRVRSATIGTSLPPPARRLAASAWACGLLGRRAMRNAPQAAPWLSKPGFRKPLGAAPPGAMAEMKVRFLDRKPAFGLWPIAMGGSASATGD